MTATTRRPVRADRLYRFRRAPAADLSAPVPAGGVRQPALSRLDWRERGFDRRLSLVLLAILAAQVLLQGWPLPAGIFAAAVGLACIAVAAIERDPRKTAKKPLAMTARAKRIYGIALALCCRARHRSRRWSSDIVRGLDRRGAAGAADPDRRQPAAGAVRGAGAAPLLERGARQAASSSIRS